VNGKGNWLRSDESAGVGSLPLAATPTAWMLGLSRSTTMATAARFVVWLNWIRGGGHRPIGHRLEMEFARSTGCAETVLKTTPINPKQP
jgi:hypothetical protein